MPEMSACHFTVNHDIKLALLTDPTPAGYVYANLEGIKPRIIAHTENKATLVAYANRILAILRALHGEIRADSAARMLGLKFQFNTTVFLDEQRATARLALVARLTEAGCSEGEVEELIGPSAEFETISEYAMQIMRDDPVPPARIPKPRKRQPPPRPGPVKDVT